MNINELEIGQIVWVESLEEIGISGPCRILDIDGFDVLVETSADCRCLYANYVDGDKVQVSAEKDIYPLNEDMLLLRRCFNNAARAACGLLELEQRKIKEMIQSQG